MNPKMLLIGLARGDKYRLLWFHIPRGLLTKYTTLRDAIVKGAVLFTLLAHKEKLNMLDSHPKINMITCNYYQMPQTKASRLARFAPPDQSPPIHLQCVQTLITDNNRDPSI